MNLQEKTSMVFLEIDNNIGSYWKMNHFNFLVTLCKPRYYIHCSNGPLVYYIRSTFVFTPALTCVQRILIVAQEISLIHDNFTITHMQIEREIF